MSEKIIFYLLGLFVLSIGCKPPNNCYEPFSKPIDSLLRTSQFRGAYMQRQLENKRKVIGKLCKQLAEKKRIIIIDQPRRGTDAFYGLIFVYDDNKVFTYNQNGDTLNVAEDKRYDKYGRLYEYSLYLKDSTLEKLKIADQQKRPQPESKAMSVFYLDTEKGEFSLFVLY